MVYLILGEYMLCVATVGLHFVQTNLHVRLIGLIVRVTLNLKR